MYLYEHADKVHEFLKDQEDVECQHLTRYHMWSPSGRVEVDFERVPMNRIVAAIAQQAYDQGVEAGRRAIQKELMALMGVTPAIDSAIDNINIRRT